MFLEQVVIPVAYTGNFLLQPNQQNKPTQCKNENSSWPPQRAMR
jgi:hypothetical protein